MNSTYEQTWCNIGITTPDKELINHTSTNFQSLLSLQRRMFEKSVETVETMSLTLDTSIDSNKSKRKALEEPFKPQYSNSNSKRMRTSICLRDSNSQELSHKQSSESPIHSNGPSSLEKGFQPSNWDVICGRGKHASNHIGNRRFRIIVATKLQQYAEAKSIPERSDIVNSVLDQILEASPATGGFVKKDSEGNWYKIGTNASREKIAHTFRDSMTGPLRRHGYSNSEERRKKLIEAQDAIFQSCAICS